MSKSITKSILLLVAFSIFSCKKEENVNTEKIQTQKKKEIISNDIKYNELDSLGIPFNGKKFKDFVINSKYIIVQSHRGFLNNDQMEDAVLLLQEKNDKTSNRLILVLLREKDNSYYKFSMNSTIMGSEENSDGYKINNEEDIIIQNHNLDINIYCMGPCGNTDISFSLNKSEEFILTNYESYNMGAGSHLGISFDGKTAIVTTTNTMEEEMPTEQESFELDYESSLFFHEFDQNKLNAAIINRTKLEW